jgi:hypothetical protein
LIFQKSSTDQGRAEFKKKKSFLVQMRTRNLLLKFTSIKTISRFILKAMQEKGYRHSQETDGVLWYSESNKLASVIWKVENSFGIETGKK